MKTIFLLLSLLCVHLALAQTAPPPPVLEAARRAAEADLPMLEAPQSWSHAILPNVKTTALGCPLIGGLKLPAPIEAHRLELRYGDSVYAVHVSPDGSMSQLCDERFPGLKPGLVAHILPTDRDGDTIVNSADSCPTIAGLSSAAQPGCPQPSANDRDGDGQPDSIDLCPNQAGSAAADGCSLLQDTDGDGAPDIDDICPHDLGVIRSDFALGCPKNGSGSSPHRRQPSDVCRVSGERIYLFDRAMLNAAVIGVYDDSMDSNVIGRDATSNWYQLQDGWAAASSLTLSGACYNIPLVNAAAGSATGCFLRPRGELANVRSGPSTSSKAVAKINSSRVYAALGRSLNSDWLFFNQGWISRAVLELSGDCSRLPILDPQRVGSGVIFFCPPEYEGYLPPRIAIGKANARIVPTSRIPNRLREQPSITAAQIGEIPPGRTLDAVLDGPACKENFVWWQVQTNGLVGWTAESDVKANYYYIEPIRPAAESAPPTVPPASQPHPTALRMITSAAKVDTIKILPAAAPHALAWSPAQPSLAIVSADGDIDIYSYPDFENISAAYHLPADLDATAIAFSAADRFLAIGGRGGRVYIVEREADGAYLPQSHMNPVRALAWSRQGHQLASASDSSQDSKSTLKVWHLHDSPPRLFINYSFPYPLTDLAFSADGSWLALTGGSSARQQAALWIYDTADGALHFSKALVYPPGFVTPTPDPSLGDFVYAHGDSLYRITMQPQADIRFYHQPGALLKRLAFRPQVIPGAEILFALASSPPNKPASLRLVNALNRDSPTAALPFHPTAIAFSPDGRALAVAEADQNRVLILAAVSE